MCVGSGGGARFLCLASRAPFGLRTRGVCVADGAVFSSRMLQVFALTANTSLAMPAAMLDSFATLLLDGQRWVITGSGDW